MTITNEQKARLLDLFEAGINNISSEQAEMLLTLTPDAARAWLSGHKPQVEVRPASEVHAHRRYKFTVGEHTYAAVGFLYFWERRGWITASEALERCSDPAQDITPEDIQRIIAAKPDIGFNFPVRLLTTIRTDGGSKLTFLHYLGGRNWVEPASMTPTHNCDAGVYVLIRV